VPTPVIIGTRLKHYLVGFWGIEEGRSKKDKPALRST